jgi:hypothetical protein
MSDIPEDKQTHADRVRQARSNRSLRSLPSDSQEKWPANLGELLEWYTNEVEDVTRAAQLRLRNATKVIEDHRRGKTSFNEAAKAVDAHYDKWGRIFPGEIEDTIRGQSDEKINKAIEEFRARRKRESRGQG